MKRYFVKLAYDGGSYHGWQKQKNAITIQELITNVFQKYFRHNEINIVGCGRTDTGVHAKKYYFHFDNNEIDDIDKALYHINSLLPKDIVVFNIFKVNDKNHARYDARKRTYKYFISQNKSPFSYQHSWYINRSIDVSKMNKACCLLLENKDFTSFSKIHTDVKNNICDISYAKWTIDNDKIIFTISANRFLRNMVRAIVGTLIDIGLGKISYQEFENIILKKNRSLASSSAPAQGLFLFDIEYDDKITMII